ncbi:MAG: molecular chaperone DnaK [Intestinibaculum porci]|uniref:molecular chaperone DnaK n=1 Tax=Intestinibaculum porci TaxID=2487118 RepID=UPI003EFC9A4B
MSKVIGIDLGTTNSCMAFTENGHTTIIPNSEGGKTTPSVVAFDKDGNRLVGEVAKRQMAMNPTQTISSIKRDMGTTKKHKLNGRNYSPQEISAMILQKLKIDAQDYLGEEVHQAVITVPAYFNDDQRQATKDAGKIAGLDVLRIINEPTSAALAYGLENDYGQKVMVFDLGGGTFDVSIIEIGSGVIEVLSTSGDNHLGGDDFDACLANYIFEDFQLKEGIDLRKDIVAKSRVIEAAEKAKKDLSTMQTATVSLPFIINLSTGPKNLEMTIDRQMFNTLTAHLVERCVVPMQNALNDARITPNDLDKCILVGGSSRIPAVIDRVRQVIGKEPSHSLNPDECVAMGAAIQGAKLSGSLIVSGNPESNDVLLLDVTPLTLSIETLGGVATPLIRRNTTIPTTYSQVFTTSANFQTQVEVNVLQGERPLAKDNKSLGKFKLKHIKRALRGVPQIQVTFDIDANGIVNVSAKDLASGNEQHITIESSTHMSDSEIEKAMREAKAFEAEDRKKKERINFKNDSEMYVASLENALLNSKKTIDKETLKNIKNQLSSYKKAYKKFDFEHSSDGDYQSIKEQFDALKQVSAGIVGE